MSSASSCLAQGEVRSSLGSTFHCVWYVLGGCRYRLMPMLSMVLCSATHSCELHEFGLYALDGGGGGLACSLCSALWPCGLGSAFFHAHRFIRELRKRGSASASMLEPPQARPLARRPELGDVLTLGLLVLVFILGKKKGSWPFIHAWARPEGFFLSLAVADAHHRAAMVGV
ncbi:hypothetical protein Dimus_029643 [Dionaea muscipula]